MKKDYPIGSTVQIRIFGIGPYYWDEKPYVVDQRIVLDTTVGYKVKPFSTESPTATQHPIDRIFHYTHLREHPDY